MKIKTFLSYLLIFSLFSAITVIGFATEEKENHLHLNEYSDYLKTFDLKEEITVAVIDSGCANIDSLNGRIVSGYDFIDNDNDPSNDTSNDSHGTFICSLIADITTDLPIKIMPIRVAENKTLSVDNLVKGIKYATKNGVDIINISIGGSITDCSKIDEAIEEAIKKEIAVVVSAGNAKKEIIDFCPAHIEECLTVSAVNNKNVFAKEYSDYGFAVDLCAPGNDIRGYNAKGETVTLSGTSFSAALVSAGCSMIRLNFPEISLEQVTTKIYSVCTDLGESGKDKYYGYGLPDFRRLIPYDCTIKNYISELSVDYYSSVSLTADINSTLNFDVSWYVDNELYCKGETLLIKEVENDFNVYYIACAGDDYIVKSETETIKVKSSFWHKLIAFFRLVFGLLPEYTDNVKNTLNLNP